MPLLQNEQHKRFHGLGPADVTWHEKPLCAIAITKSVSEGEQWSVNVPIFKEDTRESLRDRAWMLATLLQDRLDEYATAWKEAEERGKENVPETKENVTKLKK